MAVFTGIGNCILKQAGRVLNAIKMLGQKNWRGFEKIDKHYFYLAMAMVISGSAVVAGKILSHSIPVFIATTLGVFVGFILLLVFCFMFGGEKVQLDFKTNVILLLQALFGVFLYRVLLYQGLQFTSAASSGLISSISPVAVSLLAYCFLKERLTKNTVIGAALVFLGLAAVNSYPFLTRSYAGITSIKGNVLVGLAVICEAIFSILGKVYCKPISALYRTTAIMFYAVLLLAPFAVYEAKRYGWVAPGFSGTISIAYYGIFVSFLSYVLWFKGIEKVQAGKAAAFTGISSFSSILLSALVLKETISVVHCMGLVFIVAGIFFSATVQ